MVRKQHTGGRSRRHLRATTNRRSENTDVVEWEDIELTMDGLGKQYKEEDEFLWYVTECLTASRKKGTVVAKKTRPHSVIRTIASDLLTHLEELVDTAVHNIAAIDGKCSNFTPSAVA
jgi:hypothetical protein